MLDFLVLNPMLFLWILNVKLQQTKDDLLSNPSSYPRQIGHLPYLTIYRLDICFIVNKLSQFIDKPCKSHLTAAHHLLRYLMSSPGQGIILKPTTNFKLSAFADSNWVSCLDTLYYWLLCFSGRFFGVMEIKEIINCF